MTSKRTSSGCPRPTRPRLSATALSARLRRRKTLLLVLGIPVVLGAITFAYLWSTYAAQIDARLNGEQRSIPRIFGRPFELSPGLGLTPAQLEERLNDVGYAKRDAVTGPGEFAVSDLVVRIHPGGDKTSVVRVTSSKSATPVIAAIVDDTSGKPAGRITLEAPMLTAFATGEKRRFTPLASIPERMRHAVLAIEDRRFYDHPGVDVIRSIGAIFTNLFGNREYLVGGSTVTQQIVKDSRKPIAAPPRGCSPRSRAFPPTPTNPNPPAKSPQRQAPARSHPTRNPPHLRLAGSHFKRLFESVPDATARALTGVKKMLDEIDRVVPAPAVAELRKVPLYFSPAYKAGRSDCAEFHPDAGWLRDNGRDPAMARGVEFSGVHDFEAEMRRMPNFALHELAHAYQFRALKDGFDNADIKAAYQRAKASGSYDRVERSFGEGNGKPNTFERAYAMTNPMEYFAETTEAYFTRNDFFPFTREELKRHDPAMFALLEKLWGVPDAK